MSKKNFNGDASIGELGDEFFNLYVAEAKSTIEQILKGLEKGIQIKRSLTYFVSLVFGQISNL